MTPLHFQALKPQALSTRVMMVSTCTTLPSTGARPLRVQLRIKFQPRPAGGSLRTNPLEPISDHDFRVNTHTNRHADAVYGRWLVVARTPVSRSRPVKPANTGQPVNRPVNRPVIESRSNSVKDGQSRSAEPVKAGQRRAGFVGRFIRRRSSADAGNQ